MNHLMCSHPHKFIKLDYFCYGYVRSANYFKNNANTFCSFYRAHSGREA